MAKSYVIKRGAKQASKEEARPSGITAPKKLMLLFTIVNRNKAEFYVDVLQKFEINMQLVIAANGTANTNIQSILGLTDLSKSLIISVVRTDKAKAAPMPDCPDLHREWSIISPIFGICVLWPLARRQNCMAFNVASARCCL